MKKYILYATIIAGAFVFAVPRSASAHDGDWDKNHHYYIDKEGYWDDNDHHQKFILHHGHHGYWDEKGDHRIFIQID